MQYRSFGAKRFFVLSPFIIALTACGGGGSSSSITPKDQDAPKVTSVAPADGATDVSTRTAVTATFNEDIFGQSLERPEGSNDFPLFLKNGDSIIAGDVAIGEKSNEVTLKPSGPLPPLSELNATMTTGVTDQSGNRPENEKTWTFKTADSSWSDKAEDRSTGKEVKDVQIVSDADGNATVIWAETNSTGPRVAASRYTPEFGWTKAERVSQYASFETAEQDDDLDRETDGVDDILDPQLAINGKGTVIAAFRVKNNIDEIVANRYIDNKWDFSGTGSAVTLKTSGAVENPSVAIAGNGDAVAVWSENIGGQFKINGSHYDTSVDSNSETERNEKWGVPQLVGVNNNVTADATNAQIAIGIEENVLGVWLQGNNVQVLNFAVDSDFTQAVVTTINEGASSEPSAPKLAVDTNGEGIAIWSQNNAIMFSRYTSEWSFAGAVDSNNSGEASEPSIVVDAKGGKLAIWREGDSDVYVSQFKNGSWEAATKISTASGTAKVRNPDVAIDAKGNALAVWIQNDTTAGLENVVASRLVAGEWSAPEAIEDEGGNATLPKITIDGNGNGTAAWVQGSGSKKKVRTNRF